MTIEIISVESVVSNQLSTNAQGSLLSCNTIGIIPHHLGAVLSIHNLFPVESGCLIIGYTHQRDTTETSGDYNKLRPFS